MTDAVTRDMLNEAYERVAGHVYDLQEVIIDLGSSIDTEGARREIREYEGYAEELQRLYLFLDRDTNSVVEQDQVDGCSYAVQNFLNL